MSPAVQEAQSGQAVKPPHDFQDEPNLEDILPKVELVAEDGVPMDSTWHRRCIALDVEVIEWHFRGREDFYVDGNQFIYFNVQQARNRDFRGPDFYFVEGVPHRPMRRYWVVWD